MCSSDLTKGGHLSDIRPPEIEIELEKEIEIEKEREGETGHPAWTIVNKVDRRREKNQKRSSN